jgi:tocopherol cyclase
MGWYSFVPFMECYHGLVSLDHSLRGFFELNGSRIDFDGGRGYIEKDWGRSFPSSWVWMQTNSFKKAGDSFMLSIARIPWLGSYFVGFLGFVVVSGMVHKFATYTGARLRGLSITDSQARVQIRSGEYQLSIIGFKKRRGVLQAPVNGVMERRIHESIDSEISLEIKKSDGKVLFSDTGKSSGLEIVGDPEELIAGLGGKKRQASMQ